MGLRISAKFSTLGKMVGKSTSDQDTFPYQEAPALGGASKATDLDKAPGEPKKRKRIRLTQPNPSSNAAATIPLSDHIISWLLRWLGDCEMRLAEAGRNAYAAFLVRLGLSVEWAEDTHTVSFSTLEDAKARCNKGMRVAYTNLISRTGLKDRLKVEVERIVGAEALEVLKNYAKTIVDRVEFLVQSVIQGGQICLDTHTTMIEQSILALENTLRVNIIPDTYSTESGQSLAPCIRMAYAKGRWNVLVTPMEEINKAPKFNTSMRDEMKKCTGICVPTIGAYIEMLRNAVRSVAPKKLDDAEMLCTDYDQFVRLSDQKEDSLQMKIQELKHQLSSMAEAWSEVEHSKKTLQTEVNRLQTEVQELAVQVQDAFIAEVTEYQQVPAPAAPQELAVQVQDQHNIVPSQANFESQPLPAPEYNNEIVSEEVESDQLGPYQSDAVDLLDEYDEENLPWMR
jgi:hypothetical protein